MTRVRSVNAAPLRLLIAAIWAVSLSVSGATLYVSPTGSNTPPYETWAKAATRIESAVNIATNGDTVLVTNGVYYPASEMQVTQAITVASVNGWASTVVDGSGAHRCFNLVANAVVDGFTITNGFSSGGGGGVWCSTGVVRRCAIRGNSVAASTLGGGIALTPAGVVEACIISGNSAPAPSEMGQGGGVYLGGSAVARNCLITGNSGRDGGGIFCYQAATIESCTIAGNSASGVLGGGIQIYNPDATATTIRNSIIYFNTPGNIGIAGTAPACSYCCTTPAQGSPCITANPLFTGPGDYHLSSSSPCLEAGTNLTWMGCAADLDGRPRVSGTVPDIGAYERAVTHYVSPAGSHSWPFLSWSTAATNIQPAVDAAGQGDTVVVTDGIYEVSARLDLTNGITVRSVNGPASTIVQRLANETNRRVLWISHPEAVMDGLTLTGGHLEYSVSRGAGVWMDSGTLSNCLVCGNDTYGYSYMTSYGAADTYGGGVYMPGGALANCVVSNNHPVAWNSEVGGGVYCGAGTRLSGCRIIANSASGDGGGVYAAGAVAVTNCTFLNNWAGSDGGGLYCSGASQVMACQFGGNSAGYGGGVYLSAGGLVANSLFAGCEAEHWGAGICAFGGAVTGCTFIGCSAWDGYGGAILANGGVVERCELQGNFAYYSGGGVYCQNGCAVRDCIGYGNTANWGGGAFCEGSASTESTTLCGNSATFGGGIFAYNGGTVENTILYDNTASDRGPNFDTNTLSSVFSHCCTWPAAPGDDNITNPPAFFAAAANDFRLGPGSPCINSGTNRPWMTRADDFAGQPRIGGGTVDRGAVEYGALGCAFSADKTRGRIPESNQFRFAAVLCGTNTSAVRYYWDFNADGRAETNGISLQTVAYSYPTAGVFSATLTISNSANEAASFARSSFITVGATRYVRTSGTPSFPYTNWTTAATNVGAALAVAKGGDLILVSNGVYALTEQLAVTNAVEVRSVNGAAAAIIRRAGPALHRVLYLNHADAVVEGFTITNGHLDVSMGGDGAGVNLAAGTLRRCIVSGNTLLPLTNSRFGGGVYCGGGTVEDCLISGNTGTQGGGLALAGYATANRCVIEENRGYSGGGVYAQNASIRNSLIDGNHAEFAGGVVMQLASVENCTVVRNRDVNTVGGLFSDYGVLVNSVIYFNASDAQPDVILWDQLSPPSHCCAPVPLEGPGNTTNDPQFLSVDLNDFRLKNFSPCRDSGTNSAWMPEAKDLAGAPRLLTGTVDMGAYEFGPLNCLFEASPRTDRWPGPAGIAFSTTIEGTNTSGVTYHWDFNSDGGTDLAGHAEHGPTWHYNDGLGLFTVSLTASNAVGEGARCVYPDYIRIGPASVYVSPFSTPAWPYTNWATAATSLPAALATAADGSVVNVADGVYPVTAQLTFDRAVTMRSVHGAALTTIRRTGSGKHRILYLDNPAAVVEGFAVANGEVDEAGGGAWVGAGTLRQSIVQGNVAIDGGGVYCAFNGLLADCAIEDNTASDRGGGAFCEAGGCVSNCAVSANAADRRGGGVYCTAGGLLSGGRVESNWGGAGGGVCTENGGSVQQVTVEGNWANSGGGVYCGGAADIANCLLTGNGAYGWGGGAYCEPDGALWNCTVSGNGASAGGGIVCTNGGFLANTVVYGNSPGGNVLNVGSGWLYRYCCTWPAVAGENNITNDPLLAPDGRLTAASPCVDSGRDADAPPTDLDGLPRPLDGNADGAPRADRGAFEYVNSDADTDRDGFKDGAELLAGTGLLDPMSLLMLLQPLKTDDGALIRWTSVANKAYHLDRSTNLLSGFTATVWSNAAATPPTNTFTDVCAPDAGPCFYRVRLAQ